MSAGTGTSTRVADRIHFICDLPIDWNTRSVADTPFTQMPAWLEPMAATLTQDRFAGADWLFERKFDGIRLLAYKRGTDVQLFSRNHLPQRMPAIAKAVGALAADEVILDGEVTWDGASGYHVFD